MPKPVDRLSAAYTNVQRLNDDLLIAQRSDQVKGTWYLQKLGTKWVRRSLGTDDLKTARTRAYEAYRVWQNDPDGDWLGAIGSTKHHASFRKVAEDWLATQTTDKDYKAAVIRKFFLPYFDGERSVTNVAAIDGAMIDAYKVWRLNFWSLPRKEDAVPAGIETAAKQAAHFKAPKATTLNRENPTLRQILAYAERKGYFAGNPVPEVPTEAWKANPRRAFLGGDFDILATEAEKWIAEADKDALRWRRQLLADWIWVGRHTGLRFPHEAAKLTWADIRLDTKLLHVAEDTKTGKRDVPLNDKAASRLAEMKARREAHAKKARRKLATTEMVFVLEDGSAFGDLGKLFNELVARCGFAQGDNGYSPYSLRHTFATFSLAEGMTGDHLAEIMGTSVKMLNSHYKHGTIEQTRRYLSERGLLPTGDRLTPSEAWKPLKLIDVDALPADHPGRRKLELAPAEPGTA